MRTPGIAAAIGVTLGFAPTITEADDQDTAETWTATTRRHHAGCVAHATHAAAATAVTLQDDVGTVRMEVDRAQCGAVADRLLAYGIDEVTISDDARAVLDLRARCAALATGPVPEDAAAPRAPPIDRRGAAAFRGDRRTMYLRGTPWYVRGGNAPATAAQLRATRTWIVVEDRTLLDLVDGVCPLDARAVTRYTRYRFDADDELVGVEPRTVCSGFDRREVR